MKTKTHLTVWIALFLCLYAASLDLVAQNKASKKNEKKENTTFQTSSGWKPVIDVRADVAIVYGVDGNPSDRSRKPVFEDRVASWRDRGYSTHFMTGIAWGSYQDYFTGRWDGKWHLDEGQVTAKGDTIWHGHMVPYIVPSMNFIQYMKEKQVKRVIDAGIDAIYLEEPEFWMRGGYSEAFKREWQEYYGFPWRPQHASPENTYLANKLKYHLYYRALDEVFTYAKEYGKSKGMDVRCYVPTHSLVNYSSWQIVSPEASLASLPCIDGYIAQVWTGTSREPTYYNGIRKERVFENAFLEYGSMESMTRPTGRKMFFLTDPIEDRSRDWDDYKKNYQATFSAQLLYPMINSYEVMPWPERIYEGLYKTCDTCRTKAQIPRFYSTQMQVMINALNDMPLSKNKLNGSHGIAVLMSNSLMFQRFPTHAGYEDPQFSNFYGQTFPLLKRGIPVELAHIENVSYPAAWTNLKVLVMSYSNMKPMQAEYHRYIAEWVKAGGVLVYCGKDIDPYQTTMEWWNTGEYNYDAPSMHLFELLGIAPKAQTGDYSCGKGSVFVIREDPKSFVLQPNSDERYFDVVKKAYAIASKTGEPITKNNLVLERGQYIIAAVLDESVSNEPLQLHGTFIDLFDPELPVLTDKTILPGEQAFLYDVAKIKNKKTPQVLCSASRIYDESVKKQAYSFVAKSPVNTNNVVRIKLPQAPLKIVVKNASGEELTDTKSAWDAVSGTCLIKFPNDPEGIYTEIAW
ncbi:MAG: hypothetical protein LBR67_10490 [Dysgonamonadaceae bacterium]|jgi:hypothetical protein|nr:hypothetical protein [Dysgonamonadaceae bacterium]